MPVVVLKFLKIFRGAGLKILALGTRGWSELWTSRRVAVREWAGRRTARWLPPALAERLLGFERPDAAWPRGRAAIERAEVGRQRPILSSSY